MMNLNYLMNHTQLQIYKIILDISPKYETITVNPPIQMYVKRIKNGIAFKIKAVYILELLTTEIMKLLGGTEKAIAIKIAKKYKI